MFYISQCGNSDCGFACLEMLLANFHHDKNYLFLKHEDRKYNFRELINIGKVNGIELLGVKVLDPMELHNCHEFPFIAVIRNKNSENHSVIVKKIKRNKVYIYDPSLGKRILTFEEFILRWTKLALIVKNGVKTKLKIKSPSFIRRKDKILLTIFQIIGSCSLLIGTYFIDKSNYFFIPIIFFLVFIIFEIVFRRYLLYSLSLIDEKIFSNEIDLNNSTYQEVYKTIQDYKASSLTLLPNLIFALLVCLFMSIIVILNSNLNFIYILISVILSLFETYVVLPRLKSEEAKLIELENIAYKSNNSYEFKLFSTRATAFANKIATKKSLLRIFEIGLLFIVEMLIMYLTSTINVTYLVFYLCINMFLILNFNKLLEFSSKRDNFDSIKAKLLNYIK